MAGIGHNPFKKTGKGGGVKPTINVTPLVDVVLVLLIIFMVVLPAVQDAKSIEMVEVKDSDEAGAEGEEPITITIVNAKAGPDELPVFTLGEDDVPREQAIAGAAGMFMENPQNPVLLRVDAKVRHKHVRPFVKDLRDAGVGAVSFAVAGSKEEWSEEEGEAGAAGQPETGEEG